MRRPRARFRGRVLCAFLPTVVLAVAAPAAARPVSQRLTAAALTTPGQVYVVSNLPGGGHNGSLALSFISTSSNTVVRSLRVPGWPTVAVAPGGSKAYVLRPGPPAPNDESPWTLAPVATTTGRQAQPVSVGQNPETVTISPDGQTVFVVNGIFACCQAPGTPGTVTEFSTSAGKVAKVVKVASAPTSIVISRSGTRAFVSGANAVTELNATTGSPMANLPVAAASMVISPNSATAYLAGHFRVVPVDAATGQLQPAISTGGYSPVALAVSPNGQSLYAVGTLSPGQGLGNAQALLVINTASGRVLKQVALGPASVRFESLVVASNGKMAYALGLPASTGSGVVVPVDLSTNTTAHAIASGLDPLAVVAPPGSQWAYVLVKGGVLPVSTTDNAVGKLITVPSSTAAIGFAGPAVPSAAPSPVMAPDCTAADLRVSAGQPEAGLGHQGLAVLFRNVGPARCRISGYPKVVALSAAGQPVTHAVPTLRGYLGGLFNGATAPPVLQLSPGQTASAMVEGDQDAPSGAKACPTYPALLVTAPGTTTAVRVPTTRIPGGLSGCTTIYVHPVVPGTFGVDEAANR